MCFCFSRYFRKILRLYNSQVDIKLRKDVVGVYGEHCKFSIFKNCLFVCTIEKAGLILNGMIGTKIISQLGCLAIDETHTMGDSFNGFLLEILLRLVICFNHLVSLMNSKLFLANVCIYKSRKSLVSFIHLDFICLCSNPMIACIDRLQIVAMSATVSNVQNLAKWLDSALYSTEFRPIVLEEYLCCANKLYDKQGCVVEELPLSSLSRACTNQSSSSNSYDHDSNFRFLVGRALSEGQQALVFCSTRYYCRNTVEKLITDTSIVAEIEHRFPRKNYDSFFEDFRGILSESSESDHEILKFITYGICFHHAGVVGMVRESIEKAFRLGIVRILVATSTLAAGVNLPAGYVIIRGLSLGQDTLNPIHYKQMSGRAGRMGHCTKGVAILLLNRTSDVASGLSLVNSPCPSIQSQIDPKIDRGNGLLKAVIEAIGLDLCNDFDSLLLFIGCTFMASECFDKSSILMLTRKSIQYLKSVEVIDVSHDRFISLSKFGRAIMKCNLDLEDSIVIYESLWSMMNVLNLENDVHLLCAVSPWNYPSSMINFKQLHDMYERSSESGVSKTFSIICESLGVHPDHIVMWSVVPPSKCMLDASFACLSFPHFLNNVDNVDPVIQRDELKYKSLRGCKKLWMAMHISKVIEGYLSMERIASLLGCTSADLLQYVSSARMIANKVQQFCKEIGWKPLEILFKEWKVNLTSKIPKDMKSLLVIPTMTKKIADILNGFGVSTPSDLLKQNTLSIVNALQMSIGFNYKVGTVFGMIIIHTILMIGCYLLCFYRILEFVVMILMKSIIYHWTKNFDLPSKREHAFCKNRPSSNISYLHEDTHNMLMSFITLICRLYLQSLDQQDSSDDNKGDGSIFREGNDENSDDDSSQDNEEVEDAVSDISKISISMESYESLDENEDSYGKEDGKSHLVLNGLESEQWQSQSEIIMPMGYRAINVGSNNPSKRLFSDMSTSCNGVNHIDSLDSCPDIVEPLIEILRHSKDPRFFLEANRCLISNSNATFRIPEMIRSSHCENPFFMIKNSDKSIATAMTFRSLENAENIDIFLNTLCHSNAVAFELFFQKLPDKWCSSFDLLSGWREQISFACPEVSSFKYGGVSSCVVLDDKVQDTRRCKYESPHVLSGISFCFGDNNGYFLPLPSHLPCRIDRTCKSGNLGSFVISSPIMELIAEYVGFESILTPCYRLSQRFSRGNNMHSSGSWTKSTTNPLLLVSKAWMIASRNSLRRAWMSDQSVEWFLLKRIMENEALGKISMNMKSNAIVFLERNVHIKGPIFDPMVCWNLSKLLLNDVSNLPPKITLPSTGFFDRRDYEFFMKQCCFRSVAIYRTSSFMFSVLSSENYSQFRQMITSVEFPLIDVCGNMEFHGISIDIEMLIIMMLEIQDRIHMIDEYLASILGSSFNPDSQKDVKNLKKRLAEEYYKRNISGSNVISTCHHIEKNHPIIRLIREHRSLSSTLSLLMNIRDNISDNRVRSIYNCQGTDTGRITITSPPLQQIPHELEMTVSLRDSVEEIDSRDKSYSALSKVKFVRTFANEYGQIVLSFAACECLEDVICMLLDCLATFSVLESHISGLLSQIKEFENNFRSVFLVKLCRFDARSRDDYCFFTSCQLFDICCPSIYDDEEIRAINEAMVSDSWLSNNANISSRKMTWKLRSMFRFPFHNTKIFLSADYCQIELRLLAHFSQESRLLDVFLSENNNNLDVFKSIASIWLKKSYQLVTEGDRVTVKQLVYAILYGGGPSLVCEKLGISLSKSREIMNQFLESMPYVSKYMSDVIASTRKHGYVETLSGRCRRLPDIVSKDPEKRSRAERQALNTICQGSAADVIKKSMIDIHHVLHSYDGCIMVLQVCNMFHSLR